MTEILNGQPVTNEESELAQSHLGSVDYELGVLKAVLAAVEAGDESACALLDTILPTIEHIERLETARAAMLRSTKKPDVSTH